MTLANKYLRYSPEITLEIFELVWNKLIESGFKNKYNNELYSEFKAFRNKHNYLVIDDTHFNTVMSFCIINELETTVQEILGYNPFVKDDFVLPEKWYIKCTPESKESLDKWTRFSWKYDYIYFNGKSKYWSNTLYDDHIEITFDQFKKYVLKESVENPKEVIPEYIELLEGFDNTCTDKIFNTNQPIPQMSGWSNQWTWESIFKNDIQRPYFKSSTKKAFDTQNKSKSIEKWSVGSYVVFCKNGDHEQKVGQIDLIKSPLNRDYCIGCEKYDVLSINRENKGEIKWFATKFEAEEFAKTLVEPIKETKQPLKQAVHCKTQEEWDFVTEKLGYKWSDYCNWSRYKNDTCINLNEFSFGTTGMAYIGYQILSFQEWCDLNGCKMEKEVKFEVGKWYRNLGKNSSENTFGKFLDLRNNDKEFWMSEYICGGEFANMKGWLDYSSETIEISIDEIQQYLPDDHPDKITPVIQQVKDIQKANQEFKVGDWVVNLNASMNYKINEICKISLIEDGKIACEGKPISKSNQKDFKCFLHATPEEIINHLISIQIPAGEPLNTGIEPNKNGVFKYTTVGGNSFNGECSTSITRTVEIIKPATIEFNYLPEPK